MKHFTILTILVSCMLINAEPPAPSSQYLPPNSRYLPPNQSNQQPSNNYLPPKSTYGAPGVTGAIFPNQDNGGGNNGYGGGNNGYGGGNKGGYGNDEGNYGPAKYEFQYDVQDYQSGNDFGHMESRDGDKTVGRYYVLLPDGRKQIVNYEADEHGYRPTITYEETNNGNGGGGGGGFNGYDNNAQSKFNGY